MLHDALPQSKVLGIDSSEEMLQKSLEFSTESLSFRKALIEDVASEGKAYGLVFSNAAIQWVEEHEKLVPMLYSLVAPKGQITIQLPSNHSHYSHKAITETALEEPFRTLLKGFVRTAPVLSIEDYARLLYQCGATDIQVTEKVYPHVLKDCDALVEWVSGTALVPYFERLPKECHDSFKLSYKRKLMDKWPESPLFYPFRRILFSAKKV